MLDKPVDQIQFWLPLETDNISSVEEVVGINQRYLSDILNKTEQKEYMDLVKWIVWITDIRFVVLLKQIETKPEMIEELYWYLQMQILTGMDNQSEEFNTAKTKIDRFCILEATEKK